MNTSAVNSPLSVLQAPAPSNKQDSNSASDAGAFNQMLSREIAGRNNSSNSANEASKNASKDSANNGDRTKNKSDSTTAASTSETVKTSDSDKTASVADGKTDETAETEATTVSAELLAFVAALTQANTATTVTPAATAEIDTAVKLGKGTGIATDTAADITLGAAATTATSSEQDAIGKKSDFVSALDKATTAAGDGKPAPATAKTDVELTAAVVQTAKAVEPAAPVSTPQNIAAVTSAALQQMNDAQGPQSNKLAPQVGTPDWNQALGQKVVWMVQGVQQSATLTLNPPDLGPMQVTLHVSNNQATANFTAHQPEVRHALEAAMPRLREMLNDAGIQLGQSNVSAGSPNQQGAFSEQRQGGSRQSNQASNAVDPVIHVSHIPVSTSGTGIVDTFA